MLSSATEKVKPPNDGLNFESPKEINWVFEDKKCWGEFKIVSKNHDHSELILDRQRNTSFFETLYLNWTPRSLKRFNEFIQQKNWTTVLHQVLPEYILFLSIYLMKDLYIRFRQDEFESVDSQILMTLLDRILFLFVTIFVMEIYVRIWDRWILHKNC